MYRLPKACKLERYFAKYEFSTKYLLCCSDVEALSMSEVLSMADEQCKRLWDNLKLSYTDSAGHPLLRKEVASLHQLNMEEVLVVAPQEGIYIAMNCLTDYFRRTYGDDRPHVISTFPAYQSLYENLHSLGCRVDYWKVKKSDDAGGWTFDVDDLRRLVKADARLLVVNFPHNPTGYVPSDDQWQEVIRICEENEVFLFSDEMYQLTERRESGPLASASSVITNSVTLSGVSKTLSLPGLRIGWLCTKHRILMSSMKSFRDYITICSSAPAEILALVALRNRKQIVRRTMAIISENLRLLGQFFAEYRDLFEWQAPPAGTTGLLRLKGWILQLTEKGGATGFCEKLLQEADVLLLPSDVYDFCDDCVRVGFGRNDVKQSLEAIRTFLEANKPRSGTSPTTPPTATPFTPSPTPPTSFTAEQSE